MAAQSARDERIAMLAQSAAKSAEKAGNVTTDIRLATVPVVIAVVGTFQATRSCTLGIVQTTSSDSQQGPSRLPKQ